MPNRRIPLPMSDDLLAALKMKAKSCGVPVGTLVVLLLKMGLDKPVEVTLSAKRAAS